MNQWCQSIKMSFCSTLKQGSSWEIPPGPPPAPCLSSGGVNAFSPICSWLKGLRIASHTWNLHLESSYLKTAIKRYIIKSLQTHTHTHTYINHILAYTIIVFFLDESPKSCLPVGRGEVVRRKDFTFHFTFICKLRIFKHVEIS